MSRYVSFFLRTERMSFVICLFQLHIYNDSNFKTFVISVFESRLALFSEYLDCDYITWL
jgi:hypothetical protein